MTRLPVFLVGLTLCGAGCARPKPAPAATKPPEVVVGRPVEQPVTEYEDFTGRTDAVARAELRARVSGYLDAVNFKDGQDVKAGDLLFAIDPRPYQAELDRAAANVTLAQARADRLEKDYARIARLRESGSITAEEVDRVSGDRAEALASVGVAAAAKRLAQQNLDFTKITAPFAGRIGRRAVDPGNLVTADVTILSEVVRLDPMYVNFDIDDRTLLRIRRLVREGKVPSARTNVTTVRVGLPDRDTYDLTADVDFIDTKVDPGTGTLRVRGVAANPQLLLSPGLFVRVRLPVGRERPAVLVPEVAIGTDQGEKFVFVVTAADEIEYRPVSLGSQYGALRVVRPRDGDPTPGRVTGVTPADRIVVAGLQRVRAGAKVTVKDAPAATPAAPLPTAAQAPLGKPAGS